MYCDYWIIGLGVVSVSIIVMYVHLCYISHMLVHKSSVFSECFALLGLLGQGGAARHFPLPAVSLLTFKGLMFLSVMV